MVVNIDIETRTGEFLIANAGSSSTRKVTLPGKATLLVGLLDPAPGKNLSRTDIVKIPQGDSWAPVSVTSSNEFNYSR